MPEVFLEAARHRRPNKLTTTVDFCDLKKRIDIKPPLRGRLLLLGWGRSARVDAGTGPVP
ncbi:hypothetical protein [Moorella sp. Hama-1]|uniref:hypothetical protein n=1 Tax=Moorella sp. Hama-1 TaxID=2138101 RepID=UPI00128FF7DD|nr:hypothetical protein [Moorella sp. Hama-1]BCV20160.1 hypothetical protein hamaS1_02290 [Moorella sp. Hama-1]